MTQRTIFIQIASYRDEELPKTIQDCLEKAKYPERLRFGIDNQYGEESEHYLDEYKEDSRFRIKFVPWREARGVNAARRICESFYDGEDFTLQIDSHMRFVQDWDEAVIKEWEACADNKAVLSHYPPEYRYDTDDKVVLGEFYPTMLVVKDFFKGYIPTFKGQAIPEDRQKPYLAVFAAGGFVFAPGEICRSVAHNREISFIGEEITHSIKLFMQGYKIFSPTIPIAYHLYIRGKLGAHIFWEDFRSDPDLVKNDVYAKMDALSDSFMRRLLVNYDISMLGASGSLESFENYAGINFKNKIIHPDQLAAKAPPYADDSNWVDDVAAIKIIPIDIKINTSDFPKDTDYDFWYFGLHNQDETELIRDDITNDSWQTDTIEIKKDYPLREQPAKYVVWPHSKTQGWLERKVYDYNP